MPENSLRALRVFLAEDNSADVYLVEMALKEHGVPFTMRVVNDGDEAIRFVQLFGAGEPLPDIALLDLNLPRQEGDKVMGFLRSRQGCEATPIIVMSSSPKPGGSQFSGAISRGFFLEAV